MSLYAQAAEPDSTIVKLLFQPTFLLLYPDSPNFHYISLSFHTSIPTSHASRTNTSVRMNKIL